MLFYTTGGGKFAKITVYCPTNTTVVCSLSPFSFTKTSGSATSVTFEVPVRGTWTITATKNGLSDTKTVSATTQGTTYTVTMSIRYYIFKSGEGRKVGLSYYNVGNVYKEITGINSFDCTYNESGITNTVCTDGLIDLSQFSKCVMDCTNHGSTGSNLHMFVHTEHRYAATHPNVYTFGTATRATITWDIDALTATRYVGINNGSSWGATFYNWYLEV